MNLLKELKNRITFGIISHPDAGKTTLTEKLLLFGGAIQEAGAVKNNKIKKTTASDFMEIERQRGISVSTSVLSFNYNKKKINILDTPGHKDFAEDTFRTLTAVDSVIVVIDVAKGVEEQTLKLVEVCRLRKIPLLVFINKLDREGRDAFDLLDELEQKLNLKVTPLTWPIGMGIEFKGIYNFFKKNIQLYTTKNILRIEKGLVIEDLSSKLLDDLIGESATKDLRDQIELINEVYPKFNKDSFLNSEVHPIFFGSAFKNFGVQDLLDAFVDFAPTPQEKETNTRWVSPQENTFSGFVFKIHANMDPNHRNRLAFVKIVSGKFERNVPYFHVRLKRKLKFSSPHDFLGNRRKIVETTYAGDIVGIPDTGNFKIGDTLTEGEKMKFKGIPSFSPEHFRYINNADPMQSKQLAKGIDQLMDEGVAQLFTLDANNRHIIGTVGILQFDVIKYRLEKEYNAKCTYEAVQIYKACWVRPEDYENDEFKEFKRLKQRYLARDKEGKLVLLADSAFTISRMQEKFPTVHLRFISEEIQ